MSSVYEALQFPHCAQILVAHERDISAIVFLLYINLDVIAIIALYSNLSKSFEVIDSLDRKWHQINVETHSTQGRNVSTFSVVVLNKVKPLNN